MNATAQPSKQSLKTKQIQIQPWKDSPRIERPTESQDQSRQDFSAQDSRTKWPHKRDANE
jgi:hypothetical protein